MVQASRFQRMCRFWAISRMIVWLFFFLQFEMLNDWSRFSQLLADQVTRYVDSLVN